MREMFDSYKYACIVVVLGKVSIGIPLEMRDWLALN